MAANLWGKKIAILACDGFEESEMTQPRDALLEANAIVHLITSKSDKLTSWQHDRWGKKFKVDVQLEKANPQLYDAILLPGGVLNPDKLRTQKEAIKFIQYFFKSKKLVAAICHAPLTLIETGQLKKYKLTSYPSIKTDLKNAGAKWVDKTVVIDKNLITSRKPSDIPAFNKAIISALEKGDAKPKKSKIVKLVKKEVKKALHLNKKKPKRK